MSEREEIRVFSISEVTGLIKNLIEENLSNITIQGEISNFKKHTSGHIYFTLKDERAQLSAVIWRGYASGLRMDLRDGVKVVAKGSITVYEPQGKYQIIISSIRLLGVGELQIAFEKLKKKLEAEGFFDEDRKKPLPEFPKTIGIVTSSTGAVIKDLFSVISRRYPVVDLILYPVNVQGVGAAEEIANGIKVFNDYKKVDVLIIGRGGGSLEDLWAFNEEIVARAIYNSDIPIISAVGHQTDFTISDFVADVRAATPSAAAEVVVPDKTDLIENIEEMRSSLYSDTKRKITELRNRILSIVNSYALNKPIDLLRRYQQKIDDLIQRLESAVMHKNKFYYERVSALQKHLSSLNPKSILNRGYVIVQKDKEIVTSSKKLKLEDEVALNFFDGLIKAKIKE
jgi:exodeoxyribonuclease VII large subunit